MNPPSAIGPSPLRPAEAGEIAALAAPAAPAAPAARAAAGAVPTVRLKGSKSEAANTSLLARHN